MLGHPADEEDDLDALLALEDEDEGGDSPEVPDEYDDSVAEDPGAKSTKKATSARGNGGQGQEPSTMPKTGNRRNGEEIPLVLPSPKRARACAPDALIITEGGEEKQDAEGGSENVELAASEEEEEHCPQVYKYAADVPGTIFECTTADDGYNDVERVYLRRWEEWERLAQIQQAAEPRKWIKGRMLSEPIDKLMEATLDDQPCEQEAEIAEDPRHSCEGTQLWVDKYAPKSFLDLLTDEKINRDVLKWLKSWDESVFKRAPKLDLFSPSNSDKSDRADNRPEHKIILLSGPPGHGKTTLAHVVAARCGYCPIEINASDVRTAANLQSRVLDAVEMKSVRASDNRPNCVILDEIDGVCGGSDGRSAIDQLVKLALSGSRESNGHGDDSEEKNKRRLREVALVFKVKPPSMSRMVSRLRLICHKEGLTTDARALQALVEKADGDIRTCLNTLQFLRSKMTILRHNDVRHLAVGQKDTSKSQYEIWKRIFTTKRRQRSETDEAIRNNWTSMYDSILMADSDMIIQGIHENMLKTRALDIDMSNLCDSYDWIEYCDLMSTKARANQVYSLASYTPAAGMGAHFRLRSREAIHVEWPTQIRKAHSSKSEHRGSLRQWLSAVDAKTILNPAVRSVATNLFTESEKRALGSVVSKMLILNLRYSAPKSWRSREQDSRGIGGLELEPPIFDATRYTNLPTWQPPHPALRQIIAHEVGQEEILKKELAAPKTKDKARPVPNALKSVRLGTTVTGTKPKADTLVNEGSTMKASAIAYKFNEGFNNTVRRPILIKHLLIRH